MADELRLVAAVAAKAGEVTAWGLVLQYLHFSLAWNGVLTGYTRLPLCKTRPVLGLQGGEAAAAHPSILASSRSVSQLMGMCKWGCPYCAMVASRVDGLFCQVPVLGFNIAPQHPSPRLLYYKSKKGLLPV